MSLTFENEQLIIATGTEGVAVQYPDGIVEVFYVDSAGKVQGSTADIADGEFDTITFDSKGQVALQENVEFINLHVVENFGLYGAWHYDDEHQLIIFLLEYDVTKYLRTANITYDIKNPINNCSFEFYTHPSMFIDEQQGILSPGAKITLTFQAGDSDLYNMGIYYSDRSTVTDQSKSAQIEARGKIGKVLADQSFDELHDYTLAAINLVLADILNNAQLETTEYSIETTAEEIAIDFDRAQRMYKGINEILETQNWKIAELTDGKIILGSSTFADFETASDYEFEYGADIYTRQVIEDDRETYTRVCVHNPNYSVIKYEDVEIYTAWNLKTQKTYYLKVATGTLQADAEAIATDLAAKLSNVGTIESFEGPFRPYLIPGDTAKITESGTERTIGIITNIRHTMGSKGFITYFDVDTGGVEGYGKLSTYIQQLQKKTYDSERTYS